MKVAVLCAAIVWVEAALCHADPGIQTVQQRLEASLGSRQGDWAAMDPDALRSHTSSLEVLRRDCLARFSRAELGAIEGAPAQKKLLLQLLASRELLEFLLFSGELERPSAVIRALAEIELRFPGCLGSPGTARLALAFALEYGRSAEKTPYRMVAAFAFFDGRHRAGKLDAGFAALTPWELRMVCGSVFTNPLLTISSLRWLNENERGSAADFAGEVPRSLPPPSTSAKRRQELDTRMGDNKAQQVRVGGATSAGAAGYAAAAATAMGIPSMTVMEPGNVSALIWNGAEWLGTRGCAALPANHRLGGQTWRGGYTQDFLLLATRLYVTERQRTLCADNWGAVARFSLATHGDAVLYYKRALNIQPLHVGLWREYLQLLRDKPEQRDAAIDALNHTVGEVSPSVMGWLLRQR